MLLEVNIENNTKKETIKIEGKKWTEAIDKAIDKALAKVKIDGFRKGHVPKDVFIKKYGEESVLMDAADLCLNDAYNEMLEKNKDLQIVAQPELNVKKLDKESLEVEFTLTLKPTVKLGKYKGLTVKKDEVKVSKKEIEDSIKQMRQRYAENVVKEGAIENGDLAIIDFEGFKDGVAFDGGKGENYSLEIGSNTFIPGFEEQLIGMNKGETKEIEVTFPEDYQSEDLKGAKATFKVTVNEIKAVEVPELNKELFEDLGMEGGDSKESLEKTVEENIKARKDMDAENKYMDALLEEAANTMTVDVPEVMIHEEEHRMVHQYEDNLKMQGITLEQFFQFTNSNEEALMEQMKSEAEKRVKYRLMLEEIAKAESFEISEKEVDEEANTLANKYQMPKEDFIKEFGGLEMIKYDMEMRRAMEIL